MSEYHGSSLEIVTITLAGVSLIVVLIRGIARHRIARVFESTDILLPLALVVALAQSTFIHFALSNGLGSHIGTLSENELLSTQKFIYASNLLLRFLLSLCQIVVILLIRSVEPQLPVRIGCNTLLTCIGLHSTVSLTILAFQCSLPQPWLVAPGRCLDRQAFFTSFIVAGMMIDFLTLVLPIVMVCKLKTSRDKKIFVCILFGARISVPVLTIPQIWRLQSLLSSRDLTWDLVSYQIWVQVIMNLSLITACLPSLGRMMWELWAFGSGLRTTRCSREAECRDFGHELGLENGQARPTEKVQTKSQCGTFQVQTREVNSFDSGITVADHQKILPVLLRRTTSQSRPVRKQNHHYRRPASLSTVPADGHYLPAMQFSALEVPSLTTIVQQYKREQEINDQEAFPFPPQDVLPLHRVASEYGQYDDQLSVHTLTTSSPPPSSTLRQIIDSYYKEEDQGDDDLYSSVDIHSYYLMNNIHPLDVNRTEMVLQSMIDELQSQGASMHSPTPYRVDSLGCSTPRMQSSVYSVQSRIDGQWI